MKSNYFYDLPGEIQGYILQLAEEAKIQEFIAYERREAEKRSRRTYEWFIGLWDHPARPPSYESWKKPPVGTYRPY